MNKKLKLKLCYCGCKPSLLEGWSLDRHLIGYLIECPNCKTMTDIKRTKKSAINKWNHDVVYMPQLKTRLLKKKNKLKQLLEMMQHYIIKMNIDK